MVNKPPIKTEECKCPCMWCEENNKHGMCGFDCKLSPTSMGVPEKCTCDFRNAVDEFGNHVSGYVRNDKCPVHSTPLNTEEKKYIKVDLDAFKNMDFKINVDMTEEEIENVRRGTTLFDDTEEKDNLETRGLTENEEAFAIVKQMEKYNPVEKEEWEEIFDNVYYGTTNQLSDNELWRYCRGTQVKDLFRRLLHKEREKYKKDLINRIETAALKDVIEIIKKHGK